MYIQKILIQNFKSYKNERIEFRVPDGTSGSGLNIFVWENNSWKSTAFEAIDFLRNWLPSGKWVSDLKNKSVSTEDEMFVEIEFSGAIKSVIENFSGKNLDDYISIEGDIEAMKVRRSDKTYSITQSGKAVELNIKKIGIWNFTTNQFENPSWLDADFKKLFEIDFIWADTNPEDIAKFWSTTICGKLLAEIAKNFEDTDEYKTFSNAHSNAFNNPECGLKMALNRTESRTREIFQEQFGRAEISFHFEQIEASSFFKNTKIRVNDWVDTYLDEKGGGMQRSVALALLQVYAESLVQNPENPDIQKPFYLFIDEPEICLHPQAQKKLLVALKGIAKQKQLFITSHSPYFIDPDLIGNIFRFQNNIEVGTKHFLCNDWLTISELKTKENRVFFFHHRDIFFSKKVYFFEWVSDYERFSLFCEKNNLEGIISDFYFFAGKNDWKNFQKLCNELWIAAKFIFDLDVISKDSHTFSDVDISRKIQDFGKDIKRYAEKFTDDSGVEQTRMKAVPEKEKRCEPLFNENLTPEEKTKKDDLISILKTQGIFVLQHGMLENYLDEEGNMVDDADDKKRQELLSIFSV